MAWHGSEDRKRRAKPPDRYPCPPLPRMDTPWFQQLLAYLPALGAVVVSILLVMRRVRTHAVLMLIGSILSFVIGIAAHLLWRRLSSDEGYDFATAQVFHGVRAVVGTIAHLLFAIGVLLYLGERSGKRGSQTMGTGVLGDRSFANAFADRLDALYRSMVLHCVLMFVSLVCGAIFFVGLLVSGEDELAVFVGLLAGIATLVFAVLFTIAWCRLHYRHWQVAIACTDFKDHTPAQAVGFLFIPLFNLYWAFRSYATLSDLLYQAGAQPRFGGRTPLINTGTARTLCVLNLFTVLPYVGTLISLVNLFVWFNVHAQHRRTATHILRSLPPSPDQA